MERDLDKELTRPKTAEFSRIVSGINELSAKLRENIARQTELERDLRRGEKLSALGRVASGVAHEIRNPLSAIKLKVQLAKRDHQTDAKLARTFDVVLSEIDRRDLIVKRLLNFSKTSDLRLATFDLNKLLASRVDFFRETAAHKAISLIFREIARATVIDGDKDRLAEVFDNLITNSIAALPSGGNITLSGEIMEADGEILISVTDDGCGIAIEDQPKVFEPFFTRSDDGTGLGLAIAREIVESHKGEIFFTSEVGSGTTFYVRLPLPKG